MENDICWIFSLWLVTSSDSDIWSFQCIFIPHITSSRKGKTDATVVKLQLEFDSFVAGFSQNSKTIIFFLVRYIFHSSMFLFFLVRGRGRGKVYYLQDLEIMWHTWGHTANLQIEGVRSTFQLFRAIRNISHLLFTSQFTLYGLPSWPRW